ncbi:MAG: hypothetical protein ACYC7D_01285 [Nitrososphaerales archaeon]
MSTTVGVEILRNHIFVKHQTPTGSREVTEHFTLINNSASDLHNIILSGEKFRPGMTILDEDDAILPVLPNELVISLLEQEKNFQNNAIIESIKSHERYLLWIPLPDDRVIKAKAVRVIRICYYDAEPPEYQEDTITKKLLDIPEFKLDKKVPITEDFDTHVTIVAPEGYRLRIEEIEPLIYVGDKPQKIEADQQHYHLNDKSDTVIDINIPHNKSCLVSFRLRYAIYPEVHEQRTIIAVFSVIAVISILIYVFIVLDLLYPTVFDFYRLQILQIATGSIVLAVAYVGLVTNPLTHRTKIGVLVFAVIALIGAAIAARAP